MEKLPIKESAALSVEKKRNLADLASLYLDEQDVSSASKKTYSNALNVFFNYLNEENVLNPSRSDLIRFKEELCKSYSAKTVNLKLSVIRNFFEWTHFYGIYPNIAFGVKGVRVDKKPGRQALTASQVIKILNNIDTSNLYGRQKYALVLLCSTTGMRAAEVSSLNVEDLCSIKDRPVLMVKGKGYTDKSQMVVIGEGAQEAIRSALMLRHSLHPDDPLFISTSNRNFGSRITPQGIGQILENILRDNNFPEHFYTGHSFRHTACCLGLEVTDHDLIGVRNFMRHSSLETTLVYADHQDFLNSNISQSIEKVLLDDKYE